MSTKTNFSEKIKKDAIENLSKFEKCIKVDKNFLEKKSIKVILKKINREILENKDHHDINGTSLEKLLQSLGITIDLKVKDNKSFHYFMMTYCIHFLSANNPDEFMNDASSFISKIPGLEEYLDSNVVEQNNGRLLKSLREMNSSGKQTNKTRQSKTKSKLPLKTIGNMRNNTRKIPLRIRQQGGRKIWCILFLLFLLIGVGLAVPYLKAIMLYFGLGIFGATVTTERIEPHQPIGRGWFEEYHCVDIYDREVSCAETYNITFPRSRNTDVMQFYEPILNVITGFSYGRSFEENILSVGMNYDRMNAELGSDTGFNNIRLNLENDRIDLNDNGLLIYFMTFGILLGSLGMHFTKIWQKMNEDNSTDEELLDLCTFGISRTVRNAFPVTPEITTSRRSMERFLAGATLGALALTGTGLAIGATYGLGYMACYATMSGSAVLSISRIQDQREYRRQQTIQQESQRQAFINDINNKVEQIINLGTEDTEQNREFIRNSLMQNNANIHSTLIEIVKRDTNILQFLNNEEFSNSIIEEILTARNNRLVETIENVRLAIIINVCNLNENLLIPETIENIRKLLTENNNDIQNVIELCNSPVFRLNYIVKGILLETGLNEHREHPLIVNIENNISELLENSSNEDDIIITYSAIAVLTKAYPGEDYTQSKFDKINTLIEDQLEKNFKTDANLTIKENIDKVIRQVKILKRNSP